MNDEQEIDVLERIAVMNPVPGERLDAAATARSEAVLARILATPVHEGAASPTASGSRAARGAHVAGAAHRPSGVRRVARGVAIALAGVLGLGAAAYATGVTPASVSVGIRTLRAADAGTVVYSNAPTEDGAAVLERIARSAAASGDLGDPSRIVIAHSLISSDGWYDTDTQPGIATSERWDWTMENGIRRLRQVQTSAEGMDPEMPWQDMYLEMLPPDPNPQYHPERRVIGRDVVLGPSAEDSIRTLLVDEPEGGARSDWMVIDRYQNLWAEGIGLTAANRAAFARALATLDPTYYGRATDQLGRVGMAFGVDWRTGSADDEYRVLLDPSTGVLLAVEDVEHGPWILGSKDHVTSSTTWVSLETVESVPACEDIEGCTVAKEG